MQGQLLALYMFPGTGIAQSVKWIGHRIDNWHMTPRRGSDIFSLRHPVQTSSGAHPASYPQVLGTLSLGVKWPGHEANHSLPSSAEVKTVWSCTTTPHYVLIG